VCISYAGKYSIEHDNPSVFNKCILFYSSIRNSTLCWSVTVNFTLLQLPGNRACLCRCRVCVCVCIYVACIFLFIFI
jgi:hypothetical protein